MAGRDGGRYRCSGCFRRVSVTARTIFDKTRTPLTVWFETAWLLGASKSGVPASYRQRILPISSYQAAWVMLAKFRSIMGAISGTPLAGRVGVDETFIGRSSTGSSGRHPRCFGILTEDFRGSQHHSRCCRCHRWMALLPGVSGRVYARAFQRLCFTEAGTQVIAGSAPTFRLREAHDRGPLPGIGQC